MKNCISKEKTSCCFELQFVLRVSAVCIREVQNVMLGQREFIHSNMQFNPQTNENHVVVCEIVVVINQKTSVYVI